MKRERKKPPDTIYLQWEGADKTDILPSDREIEPSRADITWCEDKMFDTDVKYVRVEMSTERCTKCGHEKDGGLPLHGQKACLCGCHAWSTSVGAERWRKKHGTHGVDIGQWTDGDVEDYTASLRAEIERLDESLTAARGLKECFADALKTTQQRCAELEQKLRAADAYFVQAAIEKVNAEERVAELEQQLKEPK